MQAKTVAESCVETVHIVRPNHLNGANRLFGGILMQWIDEDLPETGCAGRRAYTDAGKPYPRPYAPFHGSAP